MIEISTKDYPGEYFIKNDLGCVVSMRKTLSGVEYIGHPIGNIKIHGKEIFVDGVQVGGFEKFLWFWVDRNSFSVSGKDYSIESRGEGLYDLCCSGLGVVANANLSYHQSVMFTHKCGTAKVVTQRTGHEVASLVSLYAFEREIRPDD